MKYKNYVVMFLAGLMFVGVSTTQLSFAQVSSAVIDEIEQTVSPEPTEKPVLQEEQMNENETDGQQSQTPEEDISAPSAQTNSEANVVTEEETKQEENLSVQALPTKVQISEPVCSEQTNTVSEKRNSHLLSKIYNKIGAIIKNTVFNNIILVRNNLCKYVATLSVDKKCRSNDIAKKQTVSNVDFIPYYLIDFDYENNYLEKLVFPEKITNTTELMPYCLSIQNSKEKLLPAKNTVTSQGTTDVLVLINAPSPQIKVREKSLYAKIVIDIRNNTLYKYDKKGFPLKAYLCATGARGMRTMPGLRVVTYKERFPYSGAPESKRALDPYSYGPYILFLNIVDPRTGRQYVSEQLLHGNGNEYSIGRKVSHGCVRTNNNVMRKELSKEVKRGDYILLINPDID